MVSMYGQGISSTENPRKDQLPKGPLEFVVCSEQPYSNGDVDILVYGKNGAQCIKRTRKEYTDLGANKIRKVPISDIRVTQGKALQQEIERQMRNHEENGELTLMAVYEDKGRILCWDGHEIGLALLRSGVKEEYVVLIPGGAEGHEACIERAMSCERKGLSSLEHYEPSLDIVPEDGWLRSDI